MIKQKQKIKQITKHVVIFASIVCMLSTMMACIERRDNNQALSSDVVSTTEGVPSMPPQRENPTDADTPSPTEKQDKTSTPFPATEKPTEALTPSPTEKPTKTPAPSPTEEPTKAPTPSPTEEPTKAPTPSPTEEPTKAPTPSPTTEPAATPTKKPTSESSDNTSSGSGSSNFNTYNNPEQQNTEDTWVLNTNSKKIHYPNCSSVAKIAPKNYSTSNESLEILISQGYTTCGICFK